MPVAAPTQLPRCARGGQTAFERRLLPGFAEWLVEQIDRRQPDYLIPAETKGVWVLEAALEYAREELGRPILVPVLYSPALAYVEPELLQGSRVMIVDDAVRTGTSIARLRDWIAGYEVADIQAVACVGHTEVTPKRRAVDSYLTVDGPLYQQSIWQLTELVVSRGLPPEVDHFVFEGRLEGSFVRAWRQLGELLASFGRLTVEGPSAKQGEVLPMTLHFPRLHSGMEGRGAAPHEVGPNKVRLFPDRANNRFFCVPISLPALSLAAAPGEPLDAEVARTHLREALDRSDPICDLLLEEAVALDPKAVFRVLSTTMEIELVRGFAYLLGAEFPGASLTSQPELFDRLYGRATGQRVASLVDQEISNALARDAERGAPPSAVEQKEKPHYLDASVVDKTREIAEWLKDNYNEWAAVEGHDPGERVGSSMRQIATELTDGDLLLCSRCISFGLAMTTLVPYVDVQLQDDGTLLVERLYRVSEDNRGQKPYTDVDRTRLDKSEQAVAVICHRIRTVCPAYEGKPIPQKLLSGIVGVLAPLVLSEHSIALCSDVEVRGVRLVLLDRVRPIGLGEEASSLLHIDDDGGIAPTAEFLRRYKERSLALDMDGSTEDIEAHVDLLAPLIAQHPGSQIEQLLCAWAMSTDRRLGLRHVKASLEGALTELRRPLQLVISGEEHARSKKAAKRTGQATAAARAKLEILAVDWSKPVRDHWKKPGRREDRLFDLLGTPREMAQIYMLPGALATLLTALGEMVERLDAASVRLCQAPPAEAGKEGEAAVAVAGATLLWCAATQRTLSSLGEEGDVPQAAGEPRAALIAAARMLLDTIEIIGAFAAAIAGEHRGENEKRPTAAGEEGHDATVLSLDLIGATAYGHDHDSQTTHLWKEGGLDMAVQWARAFRAWPLGERRGDDAVTEFEHHPDAAVLCAAAIQLHGAALCAIGGDDVSWSFHCGIDCGQLKPTTTNVTGACIDRATKLAKHRGAGEVGKEVFVTRDTSARCSPSLREGTFVSDLDPIPVGERDGVAVTHRPRAIRSAAVMGVFAERVQKLGEEIAREFPSLSGDEAPLPFKAQEITDAGEGASSSSAG